MRGKHELTEFRHSLSRITPAHAGKTFDLTITPCTISDHPRACGENQASFSHLRLKRGSPPRMRGKLRLVGYRHHTHRITPAHAGKTLRKYMRSYSGADHPRACGENPRRRHTRRTATGSPPRMRGKPKCIGDFQVAGRITPAHAGKTPHRLCPLRGRSDHPRACGENLVVSAPPDW